jgi:putative photosynthetic complex assembly protein
MTPRIGIGSSGAEPAAPPPRGPRVNGASRRLTPEVPEVGTGGTSPPRPMLLAAGALAVLSIAMAAGARLTGRGHMEPPVSPVAVSRDLRFEDAANGTVVVHARDAAGPEHRVAVLGAGDLMFVRSTLRALARGRRQQGQTPSIPFRLTRYQDGRLTLDDPATQQHLELDAYGPTNAAAFGRLLDAPADRAPGVAVGGARPSPTPP